MNFEITTDDAQALIEIRYFGAVSFDVWMQAHEALHKLDNGRTFKNARFILTDLSEATLADFTNSDISQRSVDLLQKSMVANSSITVIIIAPESLEFGLMRMLQGNVEGISRWQSHIVRTRDEYKTLLASLRS